MTAAVKRKQDKSHAKERKEHKKPKTTEDAVVDVKKSKSKKAKPPPSPSPSPSESEDEEHEDGDVSMGDAEEEGAWEDEAEGGSDSDEEMEDAEGGSEAKPSKTKTAEECMYQTQEPRYAILRMAKLTRCSVEKQRLSRAEQKRVAQERKQAKPMGDIIHRSKRIWEQLRRKQSTPEERKKLIEELQTLVRGRIKELVFKHDASRVVQTALKYGNKQVRAEIAEGLKGTYVELAQSSYGKYLVVKVMHYGTEETREMVSQEFCGHARKLIKHREASFVLEDIFREYGTKAQKAQLLREFYGIEFAVFSSDNKDDGSLSKILEKHPEKRAVIMRNLLELLTAVVGKGALFFTIVHRAMLEFISNTTSGTTETTEFIELIKEHVGEIGFTKDGAQVVMRCLALGTAKDRKAMTKSLKPVSDQLAAHEAGHLVLLTAFDVIDDTVLVSKTLIPELQSNLVDLAIHNFGRIPLLYPFTGRTRRLLPPASIKLLEEMDALKKTTSKKDDDVRRAELRGHLSPVMVKGIAEHGETLVESSFGCTFITEVLLGADGMSSAPIINL